MSLGQAGTIYVVTHEEGTLTTATRRRPGRPLTPSAGRHSYLLTLPPELWSGIVAVSNRTGLPASHLLRMWSQRGLEEAGLETATG